MTHRHDAPLSLETIQARIAPFGVQLDRKQAEQIRSYISILLKWNQVVSLTTITSPGEILTRHFGESMFAANFANFSHGRLADVGSGAGFPGLALKILHPDLQIQLIESNGRKCSFLKEIIRSLDLTSARVAHERLEEHDSESVHLDFVTARALGQFESLLSWAKDALKPTGNLILWLGMNDAAKIALHHSWTWGPPNVIPGSKSRVILVGSPRAS